VQQIFVELYNYNAEWRALSTVEREEFVYKIFASASGLADIGVEIVAYAFNDPNTDRRAPYDFFCVYRAPDDAVVRRFEKEIAASGWYRYFDQVNLSGAAMTPLGVLPGHVPLAGPGTQPEPISPHTRYTKKFATSRGRTMAYLDEGHGRSIVFVHGDAMSSYLWRNVLPHLTGLGRLIAVDLIGAGDSDKLPESGPGSYGFADHAHYLDGLLQTLDIGDDVVLVGHDWGANLAIDWAMRYPDRVTGIAFNEALLPPFEWSDWPESVRGMFEFLRTPEGERAVLAENYFVHNVQRSILRVLAPLELAEIARPYAEAGEARRPTISWPREVPFGDDNTATRSAIERQAGWMAGSPVPKLHLQGTPGGIISIGGRRSEAIRRWPALTEANLASAHWAPEDDPHSIGTALRHWLPTLDQPRG
jgi:haloalkane dehalogenase